MKCLSYAFDCGCARPKGPASLREPRPGNSRGGWLDAEEADMTRKSFLWAVLGALLLAGPVLAQSFTGTVRGTVLDPQGLPLPGASVTATDETTNIARTVPSDANGNFEISNLRPGRYRVAVALEGFKKVERPGVVLSASSVARVDARLEVGGLAETVTVTAEGKANITMESPAIARGLDRSRSTTCPGRAATSRTSCTSTPTSWAGATRTSSSWGGGRTASPTSRTARPRPTRSSAPWATPRRASTRSRRCRCCPTPTAPSTAGSPGWSSPPSGAATRTTARPSTTSTTTASTPSPTARS